MQVSVPVYQVAIAPSPSGEWTTNLLQQGSLSVGSKTGLARLGALPKTEEERDKMAIKLKRNDQSILFTTDQFFDRSPSTSPADTLPYSPAALSDEFWIIASSSVFLLCAKTNLASAAKDCFPSLLGTERNSNLIIRIFV